MVDVIASKIRKGELYLGLIVILMTLAASMYGWIVGKDVIAFSTTGIVVTTFLLFIGHIYWHKEQLK